MGRGRGKPQQDSNAQRGGKEGPRVHGRDPRQGLEKTRLLVDVTGREKEAEVTLRTHMWEAGNGGARSG